MTTPGDVIRQRMRELDLNVTQLAREVGLARETVSKLSNDSRPMTAYYAGLVAPALGISPEELLPPRVEAPSLARNQALLEEALERLARIEDRLDLEAPARARRGRR